MPHHQHAGEPSRWEGGDTSGALEAVDGDVGLGDRKDGDQELEEVLALISLELEDLSSLLVYDDGSIAGCGTLGVSASRSRRHRCTKNKGEAYRISS